MMGRKFSFVAVVCAAAVVFAVGGVARAVVVDFTETFDTDAAGWAGNSAAVSHDAAGHITDAFTATTTGAATVFRAHASQNASGGAFVGDWIADGVIRFSFDIRHDAAESLFVFTRFATAANFPGAAVEEPVAVAPNTWTPITMQIDPSNPNLTVEGPPSAYASVFGSLGNIQIGADFTDALLDQAVTFDLDNVAVTTPEPASVFVFGLGGVMLARRR